MSTLINKGMMLIFLIVTGATFTSKAQSGVLDEYIHEAFKNNEGLHQQKIQLEQSLYALKEARSLFLPNVSLLGSYTKADGGRTIDLPIGDLFNPVYSTLNQLTSSNAFPQIKNASILLNPDNFYDAKFRTSLPLINAEIYYNKQIKKELITQQQATVNVYKRELVKSIKEAYYQYYQAEKAVAIYTNALNLVKENIRVNESLLKNGVRNNTALTRAQTEKQKIEASITQAANNQLNAKAYFNFLLNRNLDAAIKMDTVLFEQSQSSNQLSNKDIQGREELVQLNTGIAAYKLGTTMQKSYLIPKLNTFLDLGSQGFDFKYSNKTQYYMWGVNLQWDLFAGGQHKYKIKQAEYSVASLQAQYNQTEKALQLQMEQATNNYSTALSNYNSAKTQLVLAEKYYNDQLKVYKEGQLLYIELLDALNQLTNSQLQLALTQANVLTAAADIERKQAGYKID